MATGARSGIRRTSWGQRRDAGDEAKSWFYRKRSRWRRRCWTTWATARRWAHGTWRPRAGRGDGGGRPGGGARGGRTQRDHSPLCRRACEIRDPVGPVHRSVDASAAAQVRVRPRRHEEGTGSAHTTTSRRCHVQTRAGGSAGRGHRGGRAQAPRSRTRSSISSTAYNQGLPVEGPLSAEDRADRPADRRQRGA